MYMYVYGYIFRVREREREEEEEEKKKKKNFVVLSRESYLRGETRNTCKTFLGIPVHYVCLEDTAREWIVILRHDTERYIDCQMWLQGLKSIPLIHFIISDLEI